MLNEVLVPALDGFEFDVFHADNIMVPGSILTQVIELVGTVDLVVADLTEANPNVLYELGVRHSTGKPVIQVTHDLAGLPFDVAGERTIPLDLSSPEGVQRAVREVRAYVERLLATPSFFLNPVTQVFTTTFAPRDTTIPTDRSVAYRRGDDGVLFERTTNHVGDAEWRFVQSDSAEESLLRIADEKRVYELAMRMVQRLQHDPFAGEPLGIQNQPAYCLSVHMPGAGTFPALHLVYVLDAREHLIIPLGFFGGGSEGTPPTGAPSDGGPSGTPDMGNLARAAERLLRNAHRSWH